MTVFANARLILKDRTEVGALHIGGETIKAITFGPEVPDGAIDCAGDFIAPGMIELHTDNLEGHIRPRPAVDWPHDAAILAHDVELAGCGITTVFDAMRVGSIPSGTDYAKYARDLAHRLIEVRAKGALRISHFLHLRAEVCSETLAAELNEFSPEDRVGLVSLMDHTPGQRQFRDVSKLEAYYKGKYGGDNAAFEEHIAQLKALREEFGSDHEAATVAAAKRLGAVLASHDDTSAEHVETSARYGINLAEFPTTLEAAEACHKHGIKTIMGAPNLIRGGSHSGNIAAEDLAKADLLDILSSDYIPASLLMGAAFLANLWGDWSRAFATVTSTPAKATGLTDRGQLEVGLRADLIRFRMLDDTVVLRETWVRGQRV